MRDVIRSGLMLVVMFCLVIALIQVRDAIKAHVPVGSISGITFECDEHQGPHKFEIVVTHP